MNSTVLRPKLLLLLFLLIIIFLTCNYDFESVNQSDIADPNSTFEVEITVRLSAEDRGGIPYFGIRLPIGWTVTDSISFSGVLNGMFIFSEEQSDTMEIIDAAPEGYYWWISVGDTVDSLIDGTVSISPKIQTDSKTGLFFIDYMLGESVNGLNFRRDDNHPISVGLPDSATVTNTNDSGPGSLRQAIKEVRFGGEILFDLPYPATIILDGQLIIDRNITITGPKTGELTIAGNNKDRIIFINENLEVNISNLSLSNGYASGESSDGGGISCNSSNLRLTNVTIRNNSADELGGGIYCTDSEVILINVVIAKNKAESGGGVCCLRSDVILTNVTITENNAEENGGGYFGHSIGLRNSIIWNNSPESIHLDGGSIHSFYSAIQGGLLGEENIDIDPLFADTINYYLSENSPCIDSGDPDTLFNDQEDPTKPGFALWPAFGTLRNDMGVYGGHGKSEKILKDDYPHQFIHSADFINGEFGGMAGDGEIFITKNGGESWEWLELGDEQNEWTFKELRFIDESVGWAIGLENRVFKTVDGGRNWSIQKVFPENYDITSFDIVAESVFFLSVIVTQTDYPCGRIIKTTDGGNSWVDVTPDNGNCDFLSLSFLDSNIGVVGGESGELLCLLITNDGGATWSDTSFFPESYPSHHLQFVNDSTGYFGLGEVLYKTTDKFKSWIKILYGISSYSALDDKVIFAILDGQRFIKRIDGRNTWEGIHLGYRGNHIAIEFIDNSTGWIVESHGKVLKTIDGGKSWDDLTPLNLITGIREDEIGYGQLPIQFRLFQNYPNPFNPSTKIKFALPRPEIVRIEVYNTLGQKVEILLNQHMKAGHHEVEFNAQNLSSGVYYYRIVVDSYGEAGEFQDVKKMILVK